MSRLPLLLEMQKKDPDNPNLLYMIGNEHFQAGRHEEALLWLRRYVGKGKDTGAAFRQIAASALALGRPEEAREAYRQGIEVSLRYNHDGMADEYRESLLEIG